MAAVNKCIARLVLTDQIYMVSLSVMENVAMTSLFALKHLWPLTQRRTSILESTKPCQKRLGTVFRLGPMAR